MTAKEISVLLQKKGFRLTKARSALIDIFASTRTPLSATEIQHRLQRKKINVNKTTIYREIDFLIQQSLIHSVAFGDDSARYELSSHDHHHHIQCTECGNIVDLPLQDELKTIERNIRASTRFRIKKHSLEFFGICPTCQR